MSKFHPGSLPQGVAVQVRVRGRWGRAVTADEAVAARIAGSWRHLPPGRQVRCHLPRYELRFIIGPDIVCSGTVCWECHNIHGIQNGEPFIYEFDADAPPSLALLAEVRQLTGTFADPDDL